MPRRLSPPTRHRSPRTLAMHAKCAARIVLAAAAVTAICASGCAVGPNFHKPAAPAGAGYTAEALPDASASADVPGGDAQQFVMGQDVSFRWWEAYRSAALNSLVEQAFRANPT